MQQTVDVIAKDKEDLLAETILVSGLSYSFYSVADAAMVVDLVAEPKALIGFAGARVIKQTTGAELPEGFQRAEFLLEHGFVDVIVPRTELKEKLASLLQIHEQSGRECGA